MFTGYFGKVKSYPKDKGYKFVSIARFNRFWNGEEFKLLAPPTDIIKIEDALKLDNVISITNRNTC